MNMVQALVTLCQSAKPILGILIMILLLIGIIWLLIDWVINRNRKQTKKPIWPKIIIGSALVLALLYISLPSILNLLIGEPINSTVFCGESDVLPYCGKEYCTDRTLNKTGALQLSTGTSCTCMQY